MEIRRLQGISSLAWRSGRLNFQQGVEKVFLYRLLKNTRMQGVRNYEE